MSALILGAPGRLPHPGFDQIGLGLSATLGTQLFK
jgi:hypothetical protein